MHGIRLGYGRRVTVRIERVELPGIGTRHDVLTESGRRIGVVTHRNGQRELGVFELNDPDACRESVQLTDDEAGALAEVLGASLIIGQLVGAREQAAGLFTEEFVLPATSLYAGRPLADTKARTRTGASVVAIAHDGTVVPSPTPATRLEAGDTLIAVGTRAGLDGLSRLLAEGSN